MCNTFASWNSGVVLLLFSLAASVESNSDLDQQAITLNEAIAKTMEHNPELVALGYQVQIQEGLLVQANLAPNPELDIEVEDVLGTGTFSNVNAAQTTLSIGWVLERGIRQRKVEVAKSNVSLATTKIENDAH